MHAILFSDFVFINYPILITDAHGGMYFYCIPLTFSLERLLLQEQYFYIRTLSNWWHPEKFLFC